VGEGGGAAAFVLSGSGETGERAGAAEGSASGDRGGAN
jgi:hypothetical protein